MMRTIIFPRNILLLLLILLCRAAVAQVVVKGTVYDKQARFGVPNVSVIGISGVGTVTDSLGRYSLKVPGNDSIYFSYLGKMTSKFPVKELPPDQPLDISLPVSIDSLPAVVVKQPSYRMDSLANRAEYRKVFDYDGPALSTPGTGVGFGIGFDLIFNARKYRSMEHLKARLEREERDKYVDHRFTKALVKRITGLTPPALDTFMVEYRPGYDMLKGFETTYDYYKYIKSCSQSFIYRWKLEHPRETGDSTFRPPLYNYLDTDRIRISKNQ
jgi:hypothetical protein